MTLDNTQFEQEGLAPILTEQFDTVASYQYMVMSGQLDDVEGLRFIFLANPANSNNVLIGGSASQTFPLAAGFGLTMEIENLNQVYADIESGDILDILVLSEVTRD